MGTPAIGWPVRSKTTELILGYPLSDSTRAEERVAAGSAPATATSPPLGLTVLAYTTREPEELAEFILGNIDAEERDWLLQDLLKAVVQSCATYSFEPLGEVLGDWEETVTIKLNPELSRELGEAFREAEQHRESRPH